MPGLNVGRDAETRHSDRFASPADRRELRRGGRLDGGDHAECSLEQGPSDRAEASAETEGRLGNPGLIQVIESVATARTGSDCPINFVFLLSAYPVTSEGGIKAQGRRAIGGCRF
jgi:hypothetical protein